MYFPFFFVRTGVISRGFEERRLYYSLDQIHDGGRITATYMMEHQGRNVKQNWHVAGLNLMENEGFSM